MGFFKVIMWIFLLILALLVLTGLLITLLLSIRVKLGLEYSEAGAVKFRVGYGFLHFSFGGPKKKKKKKESRPKSSSNLLEDKLKKKGQAFIRKKQFEKEIKDQEEIELEKKRIASEESRLNAESEAAEQQLKAAEAAEKAGQPLPDIVDEKKVSKLQQIREKIDSWDIEGAVNLGKSFMAGFSFDSIVALLQYIKDQSKESLSKTAKRFTIDNAELTLWVHGKDAADTALKYGEYAAVVFPAYSLLVSYGRVRKYNVELLPDFLAPKNRAELHTTVSFLPIRVLTPLLISGLKIGGHSLKEINGGLKKAEEVHTKLQKERDEKLLDQTAAQLGLSTDN